MSRYENELKRILIGEGGDFLDRITKTLSEKEEEAYRLPLEKPYQVVRGAGSLGIDLTIMRGPFYLNLEVKSSKDSTILFSDHGNDEQLEEYKEAIEESHIPLAYPYRLKGRSGEKWRLFGVEPSYFYDQLPPLQETRQGNPKMVFEEGKPLSEFLIETLS